MLKSLILSVSAAALISGCSFIPDYLRPDSPVAGSWPTGPAYDADGAGAGTAGQPLLADLSWQQFFRSAEMRSVITRALANNRDLRVAALNIEKARATYRIQRADLAPTVDAGGSYSGTRTPADVAGTPKAVESETWDANLATTSWEIDLFGRVRSLKEEALQQYFSTAAARDSVQASLVGEVASAYLTLLADRQLLQLTEETLATQVKSYDLVNTSFSRGIGSRLDVAQAKTAVESARASRAQYIRQLAQDQNALELLVGAPVADLGLPGVPFLQMDDFMADVPVGLPSEVLLRRPDIREAEFDLKAANANIGAARAAFYPRISLTASAGSQSTSLTDLFSSGSGAWSFVPSISLPIFDYGANQANLDSASADQKIAVADYEKAIQTAFREVSDALAARGTLGDQLTAQQALVDATQESYDLANARYTRGVEDYLSVLDSQRSLFSAQQTLINDRLSRLTNLVTLYQVLGGGSGTVAVADPGTDPAPVATSG